MQPPPYRGLALKATSLRVLGTEGFSHLKDFPICAATQSLQQVVVVPGVSTENVRIHEVHPWGPELGLRPGASRASGLKFWHLPLSPEALHPPCLRGLWPPPTPHSRFLPQLHCTAVKRTPPPVPWALRASERQLVLGPKGPSSTSKAQGCM